MYKSAEGGLQLPRAHIFSKVPTNPTLNFCACGGAEISTEVTSSAYYLSSCAMTIHLIFLIKTINTDIAIIYVSKTSIIAKLQNCYICEVFILRQPVNSRQIEPVRNVRRCGLGLSSKTLQFI